MESIRFVTVAGEGCVGAVFFLRVLTWVLLFTLFLLTSSALIYVLSYVRILSRLSR